MGWSVTPQAHADGRERYPTGVHGCPVRCCTVADRCSRLGQPVQSGTGVTARSHGSQRRTRAHPITLPVRSRELGWETAAILRCRRPTPLGDRFRGTRTRTSHRPRDRHPFACVLATQLRCGSVSPYPTTLWVGIPVPNYATGSVSPCPTTLRSQYPRTQLRCGSVCSVTSDYSMVSSATWRVEPFLSRNSVG